MNKNKHGGRRPGAGAPKGSRNAALPPGAPRRKPLPFRVREDLIQAVKDRGGRQWLESLIEAATR